MENDFQNKEELTLLKPEDFQRMRNGIIFTQEQEIRFEDMCNEIAKLQTGDEECKLLAVKKNKNLKHLLYRWRCNKVNQKKNIRSYNCEYRQKLAANRKAKASRAKRIAILKARRNANRVTQQPSPTAAVAKNARARRVAILKAQRNAKLSTTTATAIQQSHTTTTTTTTPTAETTMKTPNDVTITAIMELQRPDQETDKTETIQTKLQQVQMLHQQLQRNHKITRTENMCLRDHVKLMEKDMETLKIRLDEKNKELAEQKKFTKNRKEKIKITSVNYSVNESI